ncbi:MAG: hypothetical protein WAO91_10720 [Candidatus Nitrosotenuis sp.]
MVRRITIVLSDENEKRLRRLQADQIRKTSTSVSFSKIINRILVVGLRHTDL